MICRFATRMYTSSWILHLFCTCLLFSFNGMAFESSALIPAVVPHFVKSLLTNPQQDPAHFLIPDEDVLLYKHFYNDKETARQEYQPAKDDLHQEVIDRDQRYNHSSELYSNDLGMWYIISTPGARIDLQAGLLSKTEIEDTPEGDSEFPEFDLAQNMPVVTNGTLVTCFPWAEILCAGKNCIYKGQTLTTTEADVDAYNCIICLEFAIEKKLYRQTNCTVRHLICEDCLPKLINKSKPELSELPEHKCPVCRESGNYFHDKALKGEFEAIMVSCPQGCLQTLTIYTLFDSHLKQCKAHENCPVCKQAVERADMSQHLQGCISRDGGALSPVMQGVLLALQLANKKIVEQQLAIESLEKKHTRHYDDPPAQGAPFSVGGYTLVYASGETILPPPSINILVGKPVTRNDGEYVYFFELDLHQFENNLSKEKVFERSFKLNLPVSVEIVFCYGSGGWLINMSANSQKMFYINETYQELLYNSEQTSVSTWTKFHGSNQKFTAEMAIYNAKPALVNTDELMFHM